MTNYKSKCVNCGGNLYYNPESENLVCENCGSHYEIEKFNSKNQFHIFNGYVPLKYKDNIIVYKCKSCGSIINSEGGTVTRCASCGSHDFEKKTSVSFVPDNFVPFKVSKKSGAEFFKKWLKTRKLAPKKLKTYAKQAKVSGAYIPTWIYSYDYIAYYSGEIETIDHFENGRAIKSWRRTSGSVCKNKQTATLSASTGFSNIDKLDLNADDGVEFNPQYTYGFSVLENNISDHEAYRNLNDKIYAEAKKSIYLEHPSITNLTINLKITNVKIQYNYFPVWVNYYIFKGETYRCLISGIDGKVTGKYPKSKWKIFGIVVGCLIGAGLLFFMLKRFGVIDIIKQFFSRIEFERYY